MNINTKNKIETISGSEDFLLLLELPDEQFDSIYPNIKEEVEKVYKSKQFCEQLKQQMELTPISNLDEEFESFDSFFKEIADDESLSENKKELLYTIFNNSRAAIQEIYENPREKIEVKVQKIHEDAILPTYAHPTDGGADIYSIEEVVLKPHTTQVVKTGLKIAVPTGYMVNIAPRSGISLKTNLRIANAWGIIDSDYRGEVGVIIENTGNLTTTINKGDKIAQMLIMPIPMIKWNEVDNLDTTERGEGGFGSTGVKS